MALDEELALFNSKKSEWLKEHEGQFVVIKGKDCSFHDSEEIAYRAGLDNFGDVDFFIKQVLSEDRCDDSPALLYGLLGAST